jgi:hypothetical protein
VKLVSLYDFECQLLKVDPQKLAYVITVFGTFRAFCGCVSGGPSFTTVASELVARHIGSCHLYKHDLAPLPLNNLFCSLCSSG